MSCIESTTRLRRNLAWACVAVLAGCAQPGGSPAPQPAAPVPSPAPVPAAAAPAARPGAAAPAAPTAPRTVTLDAPATPKNKDELRRQAARRIVAANPDGSYLGKPQEMLLAVPVLEIELNANGSVKAVKVLREPSQAKDATKLAIDAVHRAAPFGDVSKLPKPWTFVETFLFNDDRRFKPRTLQE